MLESASVSTAQGMFRALGLCAIASTILYITLAAAQKYGQTQFYDIYEHLLVLLYCLSSYASLRLFLKRRTSLVLRDYLLVMVQAGLVNSLFTSIVWISLRWLTATYLGQPAGLPGLKPLLMNVGYVFFSVYVVVAGAYLSYYYLRQASRAEVERSREEQAAADARMKLLMQQFTPHFLFNNLNVLSALIASDPDQAGQFVTRLARLYRFQTQHKDKANVSLTEELEFVRDYVDLMNVRFSGAYQLKFHITEHGDEARRVLPGAVQTLVENAIKHNQASPETPLDIDIYLRGDSLTVHNPIRARRRPVPSTHTGLMNLRQRYRSHAGRDVVVEQSANYFSVTLPLLESHA